MRALRVLLAALAVVLVTGSAIPAGAAVPGPAAVQQEVRPLSGRACQPSIYNCVEVLGSGLRVDKVRGRTAMIDPTVTKIYHFELWAGSWHHNTPDRVWEGTIWPGYVDSGWVTVNRRFPNGTGVCSRLWVKLNGRWMSEYGMTCLKITA